MSDIVQQCYRDRDESKGLAINSLRNKNSLLYCLPHNVSTVSKTNTLYKRSTKTVPNAVQFSVCNSLADISALSQGLDLICKQFEINL